MRIAGSVELDKALINLAASRPVFHSEADMQHSLAWEVHLLDPSIAVRLETHPEPNVRLDLLFSRPDLGAHTAVELKYLTTHWAGQVNDESFFLKAHGAQDIRAYDVVKDVARVERFVHGRAGWNGVVLALTNDPAYWRRPTHDRLTNASQFRLHEGTRLDGRRTWGPRTGAGTMKGRGDPIGIAGDYRLAWRDYARVPGDRGELRALVVEIASSGRDESAADPRL